MSPPYSTLAQSERQIETPEGIRISMPLADPVTRGVAFLIDLSIRGLILWLLSLLLSFMGQFGLGVFLVLWFVTWWGYHILAELFMVGGSPGKAIMQIRVVNDDFSSINFSTSLIRNLLRVADFFPGLYGTAIISILFNKSNKRLGDLAAKTVVVSTRKPQPQEVKLRADALPPEITFTRAEQRNIIEFAQFCEKGSRERAREIAQHLEQVLTEVNSDKLVLRLCQYAKWFLGADR